MIDLGGTSTQALWWAVVGSGVYHGLNPGMGWPLAVSAALMERRRWAMATALAALTVGHFVAMAAILLPLSAISTLLDWERPIRIAASAVVVSFGVYLLLNRRHPRFLARVPPHRLALWSFLVANAHGAGLMLLPIYLGLNSSGGMGGIAGDMGDMAGRQAVGGLLEQQAVPALLVAAVHTLAMLAAGAIMAVAVYAWFGLRGVSRSWFNLDLVWALSLVVVGVFSGVAALAS
ncbi:MAG: hypothetical protein ACR2KP_01110 [Egibacteraceae bacterium]